MYLIVNLCKYFLKSGQRYIIAKGYSYCTEVGKQARQECMLWGGERFEGASSTILVHCYNTIESLIEPLPFWVW